MGGLEEDTNVVHVPLTTTFDKILSRYARAKGFDGGESGWEGPLHHPPGVLQVRYSVWFSLRPHSGV